MGFSMQEMGYNHPLDTELALDILSLDNFINEKINEDSKR